MKSFKEYLTEQENFHKEGDMIKFDLTKLGQTMNINDLGGFDHGTVVNVGGGSYTVKLDTGAEVKVPKDAVLSYGNADQT